METVNPVCLTYRYWLQLVIQNIQLGVSHGGPNGASSHPLKVAPIAVPAADPDGCLSWAIDVVDLCVRQHFTCSLSHTPAQDRHSCSLQEPMPPHGIGPEPQQELLSTSGKPCTIGLSRQNNNTHAVSTVIVYVVLCGCQCHASC